MHTQWNWNKTPSHTHIVFVRRQTFILWLSACWIPFSFLVDIWYIETKKKNTSQKINHNIMLKAIYSAIGTVFVCAMLSVCRKKISLALWFLNFIVTTRVSLSRTHDTQKIEHNIYTAHRWRIFGKQIQQTHTHTRQAITILSVSIMLRFYQLFI